MDHGSEACVGLVVAGCHAFELLELAEEVLDQVAPGVERFVDLARRPALRALRDHDLGVPGDQVVDDPVRIERLVGDQAAEAEALEQRDDAKGFAALAGQELKADQMAQRVGQRDDLGGPSAA